MRRSLVLASVAGMLAGSIVVLAPGAAAAPEARATDDSCPPDLVPEDGFADVAPSNTHEASVDCVVWWELANGVSSTSYAPARAVTREQMATFVLRLVAALGVEVPNSPPDAFPDDEGSVHEDSINALAALGVVGGRNGYYYPGDPVTRDQMATFLVRAFELAAGDDLPAGEDAFPDDDGNAHEANIDKAAAAGFTGGRPNGTYNPVGAVLRDQMASFLARVLDLGVERELATLPGGGGGGGLIDAETGGSVTSADGKLRLDIPAGALDEDTEITIEEVPEDELPPAVADDDLILPVYELSPDGLTFDQPITVTRDLSTAEASPAEEGGVPLTWLISSQDGGESGEVLEGLEVTPTDGGSTVTGQTDHFSQVYAFGGALSASMAPPVVTAAVGETFEAWLRVVDDTRRNVEWEEGDSFANGTVTGAADPYSFRCERDGPGTYGQQVHVTESVATADGWLGLYLIGESLFEATMAPFGVAVCDATASPVQLTGAVVCVTHEPYGGGDGFGGYPSSLGWSLRLFIAQAIAENGGTGSLQVDGMHYGSPLQFTIPPTSGGGPVVVEPRGGINDYGEKAIQSFTITLTQGGEVVDLTDELIGHVGPAPEVTESEGRIGGEGECP